MKKYGKYEKKPEVVPAKQPKAKSALLQTYFTSLLCMVLCVTMFFGTSYAWFTSEVTNTANEISVGILKVGLYKGAATPENDLSRADNKLFDRNIRWEPGYTSLETIQIVNEGDLAFKYTLNFLPSEEMAGVDFAAIAENFEVWLFDHLENEYAKPASYEEMVATTGWVKIGDSLADVLNGKAILEDRNMRTVRTSDPNAAAGENPNAGTTDGVPTTDTYTIALHMKQDASDASLMGKKITLNVKLVAYQMGKEQDSFGNRYDQMVATADSLEAALQNGGKIVLVSDIVLKDKELVVPKDVTAILDLNGHKITGEGIPGEQLIANEGTLTIVGDGQIAITFNGTADNGKAVNAISNKGILIVNGGEISNTGIGNQIGYAIDNYNGAKLTVNGGKIIAAGSSYYDGIRLFCGTDAETVVTINGGEVSSIWAQNPSAEKAAEVKGTVVVNGGEVDTIYYENYTDVLIKSNVEMTPTPYWSGKTQGPDYNIEQSANGEYITYTMTPASATAGNN